MYYYYYQKNSSRCMRQTPLPIATQYILFDRFGLKLRLFFNRNYCRGKVSWLFRILINSGAGYKRGYTNFIGWNTTSRNYNRTFRGEYKPLLEIGFTQNANIVPYVA